MIFLNQTKTSLIALTILNRISCDSISKPAETQQIELYTVPTTQWNSEQIVLFNFDERKSSEFLPHANSVDINISNALSNHTGCFGLRFILDCNKGITEIREFLWFISKNTEELEKALEDIFSSFTIFEIFKIVSASINSNDHMHKLNEIIGEISPRIYDLAENHSVLNELAQYLIGITTHYVDYINAFNSNEQFNALIKEDQEHYAILHKLFLINFYKGKYTGNKTRLPIFGNAYSSLLTEDQLNLHNEIFINCISSNLNATPEQMNFADQIDRYYMILAGQLLVSYNNMIKSLNAQNDKKEYEILFENFIDNLKDVHVPVEIFNEETYQRKLNGLQD